VTSVLQTKLSKFGVVRFGKTPKMTCQFRTQSHSSSLTRYSFTFRNTNTTDGTHQWTTRLVASILHHHEQNSYQPWFLDVWRL